MSVRCCWFLALAGVFAACGERRPPPEASDPAPKIAATTAPRSVPVSPTSSPPVPSAQGTPDTDAALPQTEDRPSVDSASFRDRVEKLAQAIQKDKPELAQGSFFPVVAYQLVKAVSNPARDWEYRLMRNFERDIHEYHRTLGRDAEQTKFLGIDVPEAQARFMKPGTEGNRLGYFRVLRSRLHFEMPNGKKRDLELTSLISWRGEWYVVHLNGFE